LENTFRKRIGGKEEMNNIDLPNITVGAIAIVPIIIAIVQAFKLTGWVKDRYAPFVAILVGVAISFLADHDVADLTQSILNGVMYGLSASGLYSGIDTTSKAIRMDRHNYQSKEHKKP
jgi:hypothetical protein